MIMALQSDTKFPKVQKDLKEANMEIKSIEEEIEKTKTLKIIVKAEY